MNSFETQLYEARRARLARLHPQPARPRAVLPEWAPITDSNYLVSQAGVIKHAKRGTILTAFVSGGYLRVTLWRDHRRQCVSVHQLVAEAFRGTPPSRMVVRFRDDDRLNVHLSNLRYGSLYEVCADRKKRGRWMMGERSFRAKLTDSQARDLRRAALRGTPRRELAARYGISLTQVTNIKHGRRYMGAV